ncbi:hypothetical protein L5D93_22940 [Paenibacillus thiaminolyticus]|nr:hypothetical protein [Paenibacillus thiaminolyticus]
MSQATGDIIISGLGSSSGGTYLRVRIDGVGNIDGDLFCSSFVSNGKGKVAGNLEADTTEVRGMLTLKGNLNRIIAASMERPGWMVIGRAMRSS